MNYSKYMQGQGGAGGQQDGTGADYQQYMDYSKYLQGQGGAGGQRGGAGGDY